MTYAHTIQYNLMLILAPSLSTKVLVSTSVTPIVILTRYDYWVLYYIVLTLISCSIDENEMALFATNGSFTVLACTWQLICLCLSLRYHVYQTLRRS